METYFSYRTLQHGVHLFQGFNKAWTLNQLDVYEVSWTKYAKRLLKPFILGESTYEGEHESWGSALQAWKQTYWGVLGGGFKNLSKRQ